MSLKRRQFLVLSGMVGSFSLAVLLHRMLSGANASQSSSVPNPASSLDTPNQSSNVASTANKAPAPEGLFAPPRGDVRLVLISDMNSQYGSTSYDPEVEKAIAFIPDWQPDLVVGVGDMVAGQSKYLTKAEIQAMWVGFDQYIGAPLRKANLPFGFTVGNHDASRAIGVKGFLYQQERELAAAHWNNPKHDPGVQFVDRGDFPFYYSFQQKGIFYLVWDASSSLNMPADQLAWIEKSLASPTAQNAKMRIVIGHLPLYAVSVKRNRVGDVLDEAEKLRSLLERYQVHTYISGHHHAYFPGRYGQLELLSAGALGSGPRHLLNSNLPPQKTLTVVDINLESNLTTYTTYNMTTLELIDQSKLPATIAGINGTIYRRDTI